MLIAVAVVAGLVLLAVGAFMTLMSVHGPDVLGWLGPAYMVAALLCLGWRARALARSSAGHAAFRLGLVATALLAAGGRVPRSGRWSLDPYLRFEEGPTHGVVAWVAASRGQQAGSSAQGPLPDSFEAGTAYGVEYDIVPSFLGGLGPGNPPSLCLRRHDPVTEAPGHAWIESLKTTPAGTLLLDIGETSYRARPLSRPYPYSDLFAGASREGLPDCLVR